MLYMKNLASNLGILNIVGFGTSSDPLQPVKLFQQNYLSVAQNGASPINYPYVYIAPSNTREEIKRISDIQISFLNSFFVYLWFIILPSVVNKRCLCYNTTKLFTGRRLLVHDIRSLGIDARREIAKFYLVFCKVAKTSRIKSLFYSSKYLILKLITM